MAQEVQAVTITSIAAIVLLLLCAARPARSLAAQFDASELRLISHKSTNWHGFSSTEGTTLEAWVKFTDLNVRWSTLLQYVTLSPTAGNGEATALDFVVGGYQGMTAMGWRRGGSRAYCYNCGTVWTDTYWHHLTTTVDYVSGNVAFYVNGTFLHMVPNAMLENSFRSIPPPGGEVLVGLSLIDEGAGPLRVSEVASMLLDELRVYDRPLTADEIANRVWKSPQEAGNADNLVLHWAFNDPDGTLEVDLSGRGAHGQRGALDNNPGVSLCFNRLPPAPIRPPMFSNGPLLTGARDIVTFAPSLGEIVPLVALDPASEPDAAILSQPGVGELFLEDTGNGNPALLQYRAPLAWPSPLSSSALRASYSLGDGLPRPVHVLLPPPCSAPPRLQMAVVGKLAVLKLGGICSTGSPVLPEIIAPPTAGRLSTFLPGQQTWPYSLEILPASIGPGITNYPAIVGNQQEGVVLFQLDANPQGVTLQDKMFNVTLRYRWLAPDATPEVSEFMVSVELVHEPPKMESAVFEEMEKRQTRVQLRSAGQHSQNSGPTRSLRYRIARSPAFGTLHQDLGSEAGPVRGETVNGLGDSRLALRQFADRVPPYSPTGGPAFSSQINVVCDRCCQMQASCSLEGCMDAGYDNPKMCLDEQLKLGALTMLGPPPRGWPDVEKEDHMYFDRPGYWSPECANCGHEFIVLGFLEPVYVTQIAIYELFAPGAVVRLSVAADYAGNATDWRTIWSGYPDTTLGNGARTFTPPVCPDTDVRAQWLRIDLDTSPTEDWNALAGVAVFGTSVGANEWVKSQSDRLIYVPTPGVLYAGDTFAVVTSDCSIGEGPPLDIVIPQHSQGTRDMEHLGAPLELTVSPRSSIRIEAPLADAAAHLAAALGEPAIDPGEFSVTVLPSACFDVAARADAFGGDILPAEDAVNPPTCAAPLPEGSSITLSGSQATFVLRPAILGVRGGNVTLIASARNAVYSLLVTVSVVCPAGTPIRECAMSPDDCFPNESDTDEPLVFDAKQLLCADAPAAKSASNTMLLIITSAVSSLVLLSLLAAAVLAYRLVKGGGTMGGLLHLKRGPPQEGESLTLVITDIQGSTTLWDSFPEQMARDIATHHQVMRTELGKCRGYEVSTEGDSFKCAFRTPEDAIMWCILVQLHLVRAAWSPELEDGGESVLSGNPDWASVDRPVISEDNAGFLGRALAETGASHDILRGLSVSVQRTRSSVAAANAAATPYSINWSCDETRLRLCTLKHKATGAILPIFRGLRVRMGVHSGIAEEVSVHENTRRTIYGGKVLELAKAVSDMPCGGQILVTGDTMAAIESMTNLMIQVTQAHNSWQSNVSHDDMDTGGLSILHLGSHVLGDVAGPQPSSLTPQSPGTKRKKPRRDPTPTSWKSNIKRRAVSFASLVECPDEPSIQEEPRLEPERDPELERHQERLSQAHELLVVAPWPLRNRTMFFPALPKDTQLTPAWHEAPQGTVTIVFTFISEWKKLKTYLRTKGADALRVVGQALQQHNSLVRALLIQHHGYEMEGEDGSFVCAFQRSLDALTFSVKLQLELLKVAWSKELLDCPMMEPLYTMAGMPVFGGPRVKVGMCCGNPLRMQISSRTGRMEYFGPFMNHAARVASAAHGGQVLLHETTWNSLVDNFSEHLRATTDTLLFSSQGRHNLKGISEPVHIVQAIPMELQSRQFPVIHTNGVASSFNPAQPPSNRASMYLSSGLLPATSLADPGEASSRSEHCARNHGRLPSLADDELARLSGSLGHHEAGAGLPGQTSQC